MQHQNGKISRWGARGRALPWRKLSGERRLRRAGNFSGGESGTSPAGARTSVSARWAFIRRHPPRWAANPRGPEIQSAHIHTARREGPESASRERGPLCPPAGHSTEDPRPNGQRMCLVRNRPLSSNTKKSRDRTRTDIGRCRSLKGNSSIAQGSPRSGYPGWGTVIIGLNPVGVRFRADRGSRPHQSVFAPQTTGRIAPVFPPGGTPEASPFRAESIWLPRIPG